MENQDINTLLEKYLRPLTFPVAVKITPERKVPEKYRQPSRFFGYRINLCQGVNFARRYGWRLGFLEEDMACPLSLPIFGFYPDPDFVTRGEHIYPDFTATIEAAARTQAAQPKAEVGSIGGLLLGPLSAVDFEPDLVLVYGNPAQIVRLVQAALYQAGGAVQSQFSGRCACAQEFIHPFLTQKCNVILPAQGERLFALTADDEMAFSIPRNELAGVIQGLETTHTRGVSRIPTPFFGMRMRPQFPERYQELEVHCGIKKKE
ncbi:MAG: DUF169 domain-containing protein [Thermodesulfobacteriota bacterium]